MLLPICLVPALAAQPARKPFQAQSSSTISLSAKNDESSVEITNVTYEVAGPEIPTRPPDELLVLRKTTQLSRICFDNLDDSFTPSLSSTFSIARSQVFSRLS